MLFIQQCYPLSNTHRALHDFCLKYLLQTNLPFYQKQIAPHIAICSPNNPISFCLFLYTCSYISYTNLTYLTPFFLCNATFHMFHYFRYFECSWTELPHGHIICGNILSLLISLLSNWINAPQFLQMQILLKLPIFIWIAYCSSLSVISVITFIMPLFS